MIEFSQEQIDRFWTKVQITDDCHWWTKATNAGGYGIVGINYKPYLAHRVAWYLHYGSWPRQALHRCDNPPCVRWDHLFDGTQADNVYDMVEKGRQGRKLTDGETIAISRLRDQGYTCKQIAPMYGVSPQRVGQIY